MPHPFIIFHVTCLLSRSIKGTVVTENYLHDTNVALITYTNS